MKKLTALVITMLIAAGCCANTAVNRNECDAAFNAQEYHKPFAWKVFR